MTRSSTLAGCQICICVSLHAAPVPNHALQVLTAPAATGFAYGFINSAYLHQGLFLVVTSYILHSDKDILSELEKIGVSLPVPDFASTTEQQCDVW